MRLNTVKTTLAYAINSITTIQYFTQRVTTNWNKQAHIAAQKLIPIKLTNTNNSTLQHTLTIHTTHSRNIGYMLNELTPP